MFSFNLMLTYVGSTTHEKNGTYNEQNLLGRFLKFEFVDGDACFFYLKHGTYIDLSISSDVQNRRYVFYQILLHCAPPFLLTR